MSEIETNSNTSINIINKCIILSLPSDSDKAQQNIIKERILKEISKGKILGVIMDFSAITIADSYEFNALIDFTKIIQLLGPITVFSGLSPALVFSIINLDIDTSKIVSFNNLEDSISYILEQESR